MGLIMVVGAYFVQVERWDWEPWVAALPIAFLVTAILQANNLRDIESDTRNKKRTIATLVGRKWANREMYVLLGGAFVSLVVAVAVGALPWVALVALVTVPMARPIVKVIRAGGSPKKLNFALFGTIMLHMRFGAVLAAALALNWAIESM